MIFLKRVILLAFVFWCCLFVLTSNASTSEEPPPIGNFSLPRSQRPGSFYSFGSNIIGPGQLVARTLPNLFKSTGSYSIGSGATLLYGTSAKSSLLFSVPITPYTTNRTSHHAGLSDVGLQGEYAIYERASSKDSELGALLAGFTVPSGASALSYGTFSYFFGGTYSHSWIDWIFFAAPGILQFGGNPKSRLGTRCYYELGVGRNISSQSGEYIFTGFLEVNGQYDKKNASPKPVTHQSGGSILSDGNLLFVSPSLYFSTQKWVLELGVSWPITQFWLGTQNEVNYFVGSAIAYTFD